MAKGITKKEIHDQLIEIKNSARIMGSEGIVEDIDNIIERLKEEL